MRIHKDVLIVFFISIIILSSIKTALGQSLHPDSLMLKVEQFGKYLLYRNHDTSYIANYSEKFALKLIGVNKFNYFKVRDSKANTSARYRPDRKLNLGLGFSYKWFAIDLAFNVGIGENSNFQNSKFLDIYATIFSSKQFISASYQYYYGYQMNKFKGLSDEEFPSTSIRDDIRTITFGLQYLFAFNYDKFSLKASFIHNEIQKKSAGSILLGASFNKYTMDADSSVIPTEVKGSFDEKLHLQDLNSTSVSLNFGYMYTFVWKKHFYITASLIPGLGLNLGDYRTEFREPYKTHLYIALKTMNSIGYNSARIFGGFQFSNDLYKTKIDKQLNVQTGHGKAKIFVGYRFN